MRQKSDESCNSEHDLGLAYGKALRQLANVDPKARQALLLDILGEDRTLLAPLRHMVGAPDFSDLINETRAATRVARKDALLHELASWCNKNTLGRLEEFLSGALGLPETCHAHSSSEEDASDPSAGDSNGFTHKTHSGHSGEPVASTKTTDSSLGQTDVGVHSAAETIASLSKKAYAASLAGDHHRAIELLSKALSIDPAKPDLYMQRACLHAKNQDPGLAIQDFTSVLRLAPDNHEARAQRGHAHALMGAREKAVDDWQLASSGGHQQAKTWHSRYLKENGKRLLLIEKEDEAINVFSEAIKLTSSDSELYYLRGKASQGVAEMNHHRLRQEQALAHHELAISDFCSALRLDPNSALALAMRGKSYKYKGDTAAAMRDWKRASELGNQDAARWLRTAEPKGADDNLETGGNDAPPEYPAASEKHYTTNPKAAEQIRQLIAVVFLCFSLGWLGRKVIKGELQLVTPERPVQIQDTSR